MVDVDVLLSRARSACGRKTRYALGKGGKRPTFEMPWESITDHSCDCSGFAVWALGIPRLLHGVVPWYDAKNNGDWFNTDAVVRDAKSPYGFVTEIPAAEPGALIVFPRANAQTFGHIGIVSVVGPPASADGKVKYPDMKVIHCSGGNFRNGQGDAIQETDAKVFLHRQDCIFAWCAFVKPVAVGVTT